MNFRQIQLVYFKEMKDILRDKRTIRLMVLVPVVFYPLMSFGLSSLVVGMAEKQRAKASPVILVGGESGTGIDSLLRASTDQVKLLETGEFEKQVAALDPGEFGNAVRRLDAWQSDPRDGLNDTAKAEFYYACIKGKVIDCAVELPAHFDPARPRPDTVPIHIYYDEQEFRSDAAESKVRRLIQGWRDSVGIAMLVNAGVDDAQARHAMMPFWVSQTDVAPAEKKTGFMLAMFLPYMIVLMVMLGAMYPAIDLTAGEKERGTLETILASPAGRTEITAGKFLTVFTAAIVTVLLGALSMTLTSSFGFTQMQFGNETTGSGFSLAINPSSIILVVLIMIPTAVLFSAALLAIAVMARSYKEAQSYVSPLMFVVIIPSMVAFVPGIELNAQLAWVPVSNIALAVRSVMLTARGESFQWADLGMVLVSTCLYASVALYIVRQMFNKESVLFRT